ncbi:hypothetical protein D9M71_353010 [compost metagenome]
MNGGKAFDITDGVVEQDQALQVRGPDDVDAGVQQVDVQAFDLFGFCQRQCDVEAPNLVGCDQVPQVGKAANHRVQAIAGQGLVVRGYQANQWFVSVANQFVREFLGQVAGADNQRRTF